jgi:hypothetical protein
MVEDAAVLPLGYTSVFLEKGPSAAALDRVVDFVDLSERLDSISYELSPEFISV